ncbi:MAG: hypothetical protein ACFWTJ_06920 [Lachnoclostridium sp.]|jgi:UDP-2,4-diacetamido-2,4,6-trideoxy-beta-L-altropyranose hydrolase
MLFIRADANKEIASGHVMRCLTIAKSIKKKGIQPVFITADREAEQLIISHGFSVICLNSEWNNLDSETDKLCELIDRYHPEQILVDSYYVTEKYLQELKRHTQVIYIDDRNLKYCPADIIINYNIYSSKLGYEEKYKGSNTLLLLGCDYIPLREEFCAVKYDIKDKITDVFLTTGGADKENFSARLIKRFMNHNDFRRFHYHVISGKYNIYHKQLKSLEEKYQNLTVYHNINSMAEVMKKCDVAISAGGTTLYELCACGIPAICVLTADNQKDLVRAVSQMGIMYYAGDVQKDMEVCYNNIEKYLKIYDSFDIRKEKSAAMQSLVDGKGADRIASYILQKKGE